MAIALPEFNGQRFLRALIDMHEKAVTIRDQQGDLTYRLINEIQRADVEMRVGIAGLTSDAGQVSGAVILSYLTDRGVVATSLGDLNTKVGALNTALTAWRGAIGATLNGLSASDIYTLTSLNYQGETLREVSLRSAIPAASAAPLRASQELADVITALEALGA